MPTELLTVRVVLQMPGASGVKVGAATVADERVTELTEGVIPGNVGRAVHVRGLIQAKVSGAAPWLFEPFRVIRVPGLAPVDLGDTDTVAIGALDAMLVNVTDVPPM